MKRYLLPLILILLLTFILIGNCADLYGTYDQRIKLTIDNTKIDAALTWFPVTVLLTSTAGEEVFAEFDADADFDKVAFTKSDGTTELYADCELFDDSAQKAIYHVSRDGWEIASGADTDFYMYYDNDASSNTTYISKASSYSGSQYPTAHTDDYVKATSKTGTDYWAYYATDPTKLLTESKAGTQWQAITSTVTNQRFHIDLGSAKIINKIYYENAHNSGSDTNEGVQNFTFQGSNTGVGTFDDLVYANDEGWTTLDTYSDADLISSKTTFDEHIALDQADPKYLYVDNSTAYRYYAFKFADNHGSGSYMGVRHIVLQRTVAAKNVYDGNFKAVYHMNDDTTSTILDSTSNNNNGTKKAANEPIETTGKVGQGQDFNGTSSYIGLGNTGSGDDLDFDGAGVSFTVTSIAKTDKDTSDGGIIGKWNVDAPHVNQWIHKFSATNDHLTNAIYDDVDYQIGASANDSFPKDTYFHLGFVADAGTIRNYINGVASGTTDTYGTIRASGSAVEIGVNSRIASAAWFDGIIDEIRVSNTIRNAAWMKAEYNSAWDTLLTYGSEETSGVTYNSTFFGCNF